MLKNHPKFGALKLAMPNFIFLLLLDIIPIHSMYTPLIVYAILLLGQVTSYFLTLSLLSFLSQTPDVLIQILSIPILRNFIHYLLIMYTQRLLVMYYNHALIQTIKETQIVTRDGLNSGVIQNIKVNNCIHMRILRSLVV